MSQPFKRLLITIPAVLGLILPTLAAATASAANGTLTASSSTSGTGDNTRLTTMKAKGDAEISRRLTALGTLSGKISSSTKLSSADKATLTAQVNTEVTGLTALKTKLAAETTVSGAMADVTSMVSDYRVYALLVPKVMLIKTADDQLVLEGKLDDLSKKISARITANENAGKDVSSLQATLDDMESQIQAAQAISTDIQSKVIALKAADYDADHTVLQGDAAQLRTAHEDNQTAYNDAKSIIGSMKTLHS